MQILRKVCVSEEAKDPLVLSATIRPFLAVEPGMNFGLLRRRRGKWEERALKEGSSLGVRRGRKPRLGWLQGRRLRYNWLQECLLLARPAVQWTGIGHRARSLLDAHTDQEYLPW